MQGNRLLSLTLFILGLLMVCYPIWDLVTSPSVRETRDERAAYASWSLASGVLDEVHIQQELHASRGAVWFFAEVNYRYTVDGKKFSGNRVGIQPYRDTSPEALEARMARFLSKEHIVRRQEMDRMPSLRSKRLSLFLADQPVQVYYDPLDPGRSMLDTVDYDPPEWWKSAVPGLALFPMGALLMVVSRLLASVRTAPDEGTRLLQVRPARSELKGRKPMVPQREDWLGLLHRGELLLSQGNYEDALVSFQKAMVVAPGEAGTQYSEIKILLGMGECHAGLGRKDEAIRCFGEAAAQAVELPGNEAAALASRALARKSALLQPAASGTEDNGISPWADSAEISSPDGRVSASLREGREIGMDGPTTGTLFLSNGLSWPGCNPSMIWSSDSGYLAVPQWTDDMRQRLMIISLSRGAVRYASGRYRVLRLDVFTHGIIGGVDSPRHEPQQISVDISSIDWSEASDRGPSK